MSESVRTRAPRHARGRVRRSRAPLAQCTTPHATVEAPPHQNVPPTPTPSNSHPHRSRAHPAAPRAHMRFSTGAQYTSRIPAPRATHIQGSAYHPHHPSRQDSTEDVSMGFEAPAPAEVRSVWVERGVCIRNPQCAHNHPPQAQPTHSISAWTHTVCPQCARTSFALVCTHFRGVGAHTPFASARTSPTPPSDHTHPRLSKRARTPLTHFSRYAPPASARTYPIRLSMHAP